MQYRRYTNKAVINISRDAIHLFINKQIDEFLEYLDDSFVFIADYNSPFLHGVSQFVNYIKEEKDFPPVNIQQEEYEIISHERHLWVSCGHYIASLDIGGQTVISKHYFTLTWKQQENELKLIHAMTCHVKDFLYSENLSPIPMQDKISILDISGKIRCLYPDEIFHIKATDKICNFYTKTEAFRHECH